METGWQAEMKVCYQLSREGHCFLSPERILSITPGAQSDVCDMTGYHDDYGTYYGDVKVLEDLSSYQAIGWNAGDGLLKTIRLDNERNNEPNPNLLPVTREKLLNKKDPKHLDLTISFLVGQLEPGEMPEFCLEIPWTTRDTWIKQPKQYKPPFNKVENDWLWIDLDNPAIKYHEWWDMLKNDFLVSDKQVKYRDPVQLMKRMIEDLS